MTIPNGFTRADIMQERVYNEKGHVPGAAKLLEVDGALLVRLAPPKYDATLTRRPLIREALRGKRGAEALAWYRDEYEKGWRAASRSSEFPSGTHAFDDGYLDRAAGRPKWHLAHCLDHDECGEG